uniref:E3 ubiquitin-protein ligase FANCL n=1 Tax=Anthurium amnicola TaxID=1678845 RepID=A0A1D1Y2S0_9ARAE
MEKNLVEINARGGNVRHHHLSPPSSSFYQAIYSEIEEIGWEHLIRLEEDLSSLSFRVLDTNERAHSMEVVLPHGYPQSAPSITADVPYACELRWSKCSRLKDVMQQFHKHLEKLQEFWSILDDIDKNLWVVEPRQQSHSASFRRICLGNDCHVLFFINPKKPRSLPECRFFGPDLLTDSLRKSWKRNSQRWINIKPFPENLETLLGVALPAPPVTLKDNEQAECGICYVNFLPNDDELGAKSGSAVDYTCDNPNCSKSFHTICLRDWLRSITTTRQSFDVLFGKCPYCSEAVAVKLSNNE